MLRDRHDPLNRFDLVPQLGREIDPERTQLDRLLDDDGLFQTVRTDLLQCDPRTASRGRHSTPVEVSLRMRVVKRLYRWSDEEMEHVVVDRLVLRQFCRAYMTRIVKKRIKLTPKGRAGKRVARSAAGVKRACPASTRPRCPDGHPPCETGCQATTIPAAEGPIRTQRGETVA